MNRKGGVSGRILWVIVLLILLVIFLILFYLVGIKFLEDFSKKLMHW